MDESKSLLNMITLPTGLILVTGLVGESPYAAMFGQARFPMSAGVVSGR